MFRALVAPLIDLLVPPRGSDLVVRSLELEDLHNLQTTEGLPYHDEAVRALVWEIKYYANPAALVLASELLAEEVVALAAEELGVPLLIPVPMHAARLRERGHNQTEVLCKAILNTLGEAAFRGEGKAWPSGLERPRRGMQSSPVEYACALSRIVDTPTQQGLERTKRLHNVKNSMVADTSVKDRTCIVVDDVTTTGATLHEAKRALKAAGARAVYCVTLAYS